MTIFIGSEDVMNGDIAQLDALTLSADASDFGWAPGFFPERVETDLGNGQDFTRCYLCSDYAKYKQTAGCLTLTVFND